MMMIFGLCLCAGTFPGEAQKSSSVCACEKGNKSGAILHCVKTEHEEKKKVTEDAG